MKNKKPTPAQVKQALLRNDIVFIVNKKPVAIYETKRRSSLRDDKWDDNHQD